MNQSQHNMFKLLPKLIKSSTIRLRADISRLKKDGFTKIEYYKIGEKRRVDNPDGNSRPVFLFGCQRSGTNMATRALAKSWKVEFFNEDNPAAFNNECMLLDIATITQIIYQSHARIVLFKPIMDTYRADWLLENIVGSKSLFIFRHFDDVANSLIRSDTALGAAARHFDFFLSKLTQETQKKIRVLRRHATGFESLAALFWYIQNSFYYDLELDVNPRVKLIFYEDIVQNPEQYLQNICQFFELDYEYEMTEGIRQSSIKRYPSPWIAPKIRCACESLLNKLQANY